jgi:hypothetical protein
MLDHELAIVDRARRSAWGDEIAFLEDAEVRLVAVEQVEHRCPPEDAPDHSAGLKRCLLPRRQSIDAGSEDRMHRVRHREACAARVELPSPFVPDECARVDELPDQLLQEEGVAVGALYQKVS